MSDHIPGPDADPGAAWSRVQQYLDKLADALCDLDEAGGVIGVSRAQGWRPGRVDAARAKLRAVRDQIDAGLIRANINRGDRAGLRRH